MTAAFRSVLCGVDGSEGSSVAVRQAAALAGRLELVAVVPSGVGGAARRLLHAAGDVARDAGATPRVHTIEASDETGALLHAARGHDLLAVGANRGGRLAGFATGSTATAALHRAPCPVLVARAGPDDREFPATILFADDGGAAAGAAARLTAAIAAQHRSQVLIASPVLFGQASRRVLAERAATIREACGVEPLPLSVQHSPGPALIALATEERASLVVMGSRNLRGVTALGSVSQRVAHEASCSVLVARH